VLRCFFLLKHKAANCVERIPRLQPSLGISCDIVDLV
jgi:hypothetical protein